MSTDPNQRAYDDGYADGLNALANAVQAVMDGVAVGTVFRALEVPACDFDVEEFLRRISALFADQGHTVLPPDPAEESE